MRSWAGRLALVLALVGGCDRDGDGSGHGSEAEAEAGTTVGADTDGDTDTDGEPACATAPVITYDTFGRGFLATYCNGCHGGEVVNRQNAPMDIVFDTDEQVSMLADRIYARVFPAEGFPPMPPAGGIVAADADRARVWLRCYP